MSSEDKTPAWVWIVAYLLLIAGLGTMASTRDYVGDSPPDDGCSSGVSQMGCFP